MSASIFWRPLRNAPKSLRVSAPSAFVTAMERAFDGKGPWIVGPQHVDRLSAMAAVYGGMDEMNPYTQMILLVDAHGASLTIEVWPEY